MRTCKSCQTKFEPKYNTIQPTCSIQCAIDYANEKKLKERRKDTRKRKQALKTLPDWKKDAQNNAFNPYIRYRDRGQVCISCGKSEQELNIKNPISMVCGHYLSVGAYPELRFHPFNAHLQCTRCNGGAGKYGQFNSKALTVTQEYRERLIKKIGQSNVDWLESPHQAQNLTIDDAKEIKAYYKNQLKYLKSV